MNKSNLEKVVISKDNTSTYAFMFRCEICGREAIRGNPFAAKYCKYCAKIQQREKTRLRNIRYRARKQANG